jgi:hypothetical protein
MMGRNSTGGTIMKEVHARHGLRAGQRGQAVSGSTENHRGCERGPATIPDCFEQEYKGG